MKPTNSVVLIVCGKIANKNSKIDWPDLNYPGSGQTILRTVHDVDFEKLAIQLDGPDGPRFHVSDFPQGVGFFKQITK